MPLSTTMPYHKTTDDSHHCNRICRPFSVDQDKDQSSSLSSSSMADATATVNATASRSVLLRRNNTATTTRPAVVIPPTRLLESLQETCDAWNDFPLLLGEIIGQPLILSFFCPMLYILEIVIHLIRVIIVAGVWGRQLSSHPGAQMLKKGYSRVMIADTYCTI